MTPPDSPTLPEAPAAAAASALPEAPDTRAPAADPDSVLAVVSRLLREVIGDDGGLGPPITLDTSFNEDLELESIELVALAEKLQDHYGKRIDFAGWLSRMELHDILALRVGRLVDHIVGSLRA